MDVERGDVFLVDLNPVVGTEQSGIRPSLIIQIDRPNEKSPHTIIVPFTNDSPVYDQVRFVMEVPYEVIASE